jgi:hypothetical protein
MDSYRLIDKKTKVSVVVSESSSDYNKKGIHNNHTGVSGIM